MKGSFQFCLSFPLFLFFLYAKTFLSFYLSLLSKGQKMEIFEHLLCQYLCLRFSRRPVPSGSCLAIFFVVLPAVAGHGS